jgi:hypothetical protein
MMVIILSANEAGAVSGPSSATPSLAAIRPVPLIDGRFILGTNVLTDPAHAAHHDFMSTLPQADLATITVLLPAEVSEVAAIAPAPLSIGSKIMGAVKAAWSWVTS